MNQQSSTYKYLVYGLCDPITHDVRYVGKSCSGLYRPKSHTEPHNIKSKSKKNSWIKNLLGRGLKPEICILAIRGNAEIVEELEIFFIKHYREYYKKKGNSKTLTNMTEGGTGGDTGSSWKKWKSVIATNVKTGEEKCYLFVQATRFGGFQPTKVSAICRGKRPIHLGFTFKYAK